MVIKLRDGVICIKDKKGLKNVGLSENFIYFKDDNYGMVLKLHKNEIEKFIKYRPYRVSSDGRFSLSYSNYANDTEIDIIVNYLIEKYRKRKYKTVYDLVSSKTRFVNKKKMLIKDFTNLELAEFIENKKKGETVCQS